MLTCVAVSGYRSLRDVVVPLHGLDVVTGANGSGKSSLYRALRLLAGCGRGEVIGSLAREGGLQSALWAGPATLGGTRKQGYAAEGTRRKGPVSLRLGFASSDFGYLVDLGLPQQSSGAEGASAFLRDPEIKREVVWAGPVMRPNTVLVRRRWSIVETRSVEEAEWDGGWGADEWESDPEPRYRFPPDEELVRVRDEPVPEAELARAKQHLIGTHEIGLQRNGSRAALLALDACYGLGMDNFLHYADHVATVTAEDVRAVARRVIDFNHSALAIVGP